jgi:Flp pilus assembly pilin Flp
MLCKQIKDEKGQTMAEYTLMVVVIVSVMFAVFGKLEEHLITNPDSIQSKYLSEFKDAFAGQNASNCPYCYFKIPR